jgi:membrane protease YdiL (CAAX protease family)
MPTESNRPERSAHARVSGDPDPASSQRSSGLLSPVVGVTVLLWVAAVLVMGFADRRVPVLAFVVAGYAGYLAAVGAWLLPKSAPVAQPDVLRVRATGLRLALRCTVVLVSLIFVYTDDIVAALPDAPLRASLTASLVAVRGIRLVPGLGGFELYRFGTYAMLPGLLLLALGAQPRELGLCWPAARTALATFICLAPVVSFVGWWVAAGRLAPTALAALMLHNLLSNGLTEEFQCRGMVLSHLRAFLTTGWAQLGQAIVFALLHFHPVEAEEQAAPWRSLAEDVAFNLPVALAFGLLALRSRSLVLPTLLHVFRLVPWE